MSELLRHLKSRRSIPAVNLTEPAPDAVTLASMLTIAVRVPDNGKLAPGRFIVYRTQDRDEIGRRLQEIWQNQTPDADPQRLEQERTRFARAPLVIGVVSTASDHPKIPSGSNNYPPVPCA